MGTIQDKCEECLNCSNAEEIEFKKERIDNLKSDLSPNLRAKG